MYRSYEMSHKLAIYVLKYVYENNKNYYMTLFNIK